MWRTLKGAHDDTGKQSNRVAQFSCTLTTDSDSPADSLIRRLVNSDLQANSHVRRLVMYARLGRRCSSPRPAGLEQYAWTRAWIATGARVFALGAREPAWRRDCSATVVARPSGLCLTRDSIASAGRWLRRRQRSSGSSSNNSSSSSGSGGEAAAQQPMLRRQYHAYLAVPPGYSY